MNWYKKSSIFCQKFDCSNPFIQKLLKSLGFDQNGDPITFHSSDDPEAEIKRKAWRDQEYEHGPA